MAAPEPWILQTQATLGTIVKKPKLTDNLLTKPPFRFLHDVVSAVAEHTGFPSGLFEGAELNAKEIKDKEAKITYLTKLIDCVGNALGSQVSVNPKKIVAGHEPERTNALLQALFDAATGDPDLARQGVERTLAGEKPAGKARSEAKPERPQSSSKAKRSDADQPEPQGNASEAFPEAPPSLQEPAAEKPRRRRKPDPEAEQTPPPKAQPREQPRAEQPAPPSPQADSNEFRPPANRSNLPERPQTARRAPPKVKTNEVPVDRPPSGKVSEPVGGRDKPGAVSGTVAAPMVIGENDESDDDDGMIITAETAGPDQPAAAAQEHGGLVADLLDAQKAQTAEEEARKAQVAQQDAVPASQPGGGGIIIQRKIGKQGGKENYGNEVKTLRESIQRLCQFTNPLGKTMDYIQEDLVNMQKELEQWKNERQRRALELEELNKDSEDNLMPLVGKQAKQSEAVKEMKDKITSMKTQISTNDDKIAKILQTVTEAQ